VSKAPILTEVRRVQIQAMYGLGFRSPRRRIRAPTPMRTSAASDGAVFVSCGMMQPLKKSPREEGVARFEDAYRACKRVVALGRSRWPRLRGRALRRRDLHPRAARRLLLITDQPPFPPQHPCSPWRVPSIRSTRSHGAMA
jgi:hypothetical protein